MSNDYLYYKAINWNVIEDALDNATWERATSLFWLDTRIPIREDYEKWQQLSDQEKEQLNKCLVLLANLATYQSIEAGEVIRNSERSQQEVAIFNNLQFTEMVNTKAYNTVLRQFNQDDDLVDALLLWVDTDKQVAERLLAIDRVYQGKNPLKKRFMALCVEGLMIYSQLAYLLELWVTKKFVNLGEMVKMVLMNASLQSHYFSHKLRILMDEADESEADAFKEWGQAELKAMVEREEALIQTVLAGESQHLAVSLIRQEANGLLRQLGLPAAYTVDESELLIKVNTLLAKLRQHDLTPQKPKTQVVETAMADDDYDF